MGRAVLRQSWLVELWRGEAVVEAVREHVTGRRLAGTGPYWLPWAVFDLSVRPKANTGACLAGC